MMASFLGILGRDTMVPRASHKWADWLHKSYCLGRPQRFKMGEKISHGP